MLLIIKVEKYPFVADVEEILEATSSDMVIDNNENDGKDIEI